MGKFSSSFMYKSPLPKHGEKFIEKAKKLSEKSGTPGDFDRDNPEVLKQLEKAKKAEAEHGSPLEGAYTSAAGQGSTYMSNRQAFQKLQSDIVTGAKKGDIIEKEQKAKKACEIGDDNKPTGKIYQVSFNEKGEKTKVCK